jgi:hypothetical protein
MEYSIKSVEYYRTWRVNGQIVIIVTKLPCEPVYMHRIMDTVPDELNIWIFLGGPYKYPMQSCQNTAKFFPTRGLVQRYFLGL